LHSNDLWPWVPHLKQVTLEGPVVALEEAVEDTICFMRLCDMGWPDLLSKLAVMVMMVIDNLVSPMISPR
jgi:hypothetical protein